MVARLPLDQRIDAHRQSLLSQPFPGFGHALKPFYGFDDDYVPLNNGSFGACPNYVLDIYKEFLDEAERRPDSFLRLQYQPYLNKARKDLAELVGCHVDDLVFVSNATSGVNVVLRGLNGTWKKGDAILQYDTVYGACGKTAQYIVDSNADFDLQLVTVPLSYPLTHEQVVAKTEQAILDAQAKGLKVRVGIVDAISSVPGVIFPWENIVELFRQHNILSLIDGAHAVGQIPLNLKKSDPDFFISNCHKWLSAHRGVAFLYTPKRNQHISLAIPTSHSYISSNLPPQKGPALIPTDAPSNYIATWEWTGTIDFGNYLTVSAAIEFRRWMQGEQNIMQYNTALAKKAGQIVSSRLGKGSTVMEVEGNELTAAMVNISIPITPQEGEDKQTELRKLAYSLQSRFAKENDTFVMFYVHDDKIWIRLSAQVWLVDQDFVWVADRLDRMLLEVGLETKAKIA